MTARDEKWELTFKHLHDLRKSTKTMRFATARDLFKTEGKRAQFVDMDLAAECVGLVDELLSRVEAQLATARALDYHAHRADLEE